MEKDTKYSSSLSPPPSNTPLNGTAPENALLLASPVNPLRMDTGVVGGVDEGMEAETAGCIGLDDIAASVEVREYGPGLSVPRSSIDLKFLIASSIAILLFCSSITARISLSLENTTKFSTWSSSTSISSGSLGGRGTGGEELASATTVVLGTTKVVSGAPLLPLVLTGVRGGGGGAALVLTCRTPSVGEVDVGEFDVVSGVEVGVLGGDALGGTAVG